MSVLAPNPNDTAGRTTWVPMGSGTIQDARRLSAVPAPSNVASIIFVSKFPLSATESQSNVFPEDTASVFARLASEWHTATDDCSLSSQILSDSRYLRLIGMGRKVVPLILADLRDNGGFWYPALEAITGESPELPDERISRRGMRNAWLRWGHEHGIIK